MQHVYWGGSCGSDVEIESLLKKWDKFVEGEHVDDPCQVAARLMSEGAIIGWVRGRSEFGPRALGNRSILADPRPAENKDVINALVKKREAFRPFAPSVLEEYAPEFFDLPAGSESFPFMLFTVPVREKYRTTLCAITHIDGTARLQTVSRKQNEAYWRLIDIFRQLTGIPVLLNTSFNNYAEPIVESAGDSLVCFLTTGLPILVIENWIIRKKPASAQALLSLKLGLPGYTKLCDKTTFKNGVERNGRNGNERLWRRLLPRILKRRTVSGEKKYPARIVGNTFDTREVIVRDEVFRMLLLSDGYQSIEELMEHANVEKDPGTRLMCLGQLQELWERRMVSLSP